MDTLRFFVFPGGVPPKKAHEEDIGCDLGVRAIIDMGMCGAERNTLFDFESVCRTECPLHLFDCEKILQDADERFLYRLDKGCSISVGLGVAVEIPEGHAGYVEPRGSSIRKVGRASRLEVANSRVPIDMFKGEIWAELVNHGPEPFFLWKGIYLVQLVIRPVFWGKLDYDPLLVTSLDEFSPCSRGVGCNGSSG